MNLSPEDAHQMLAVRLCAKPALILSQLPPTPSISSAPENSLLDRLHPHLAGDLDSPFRYTLDSLGAAERLRRVGFGE